MKSMIWSLLGRFLEPRLSISLSKATYSGAGDMALVTYKDSNGRTQVWQTTEDRLDHVLDICEAKGLEVIDFEVLR